MASPRLPRPAWFPEELVPAVGVASRTTVCASAPSRGPSAPARGPSAPARRRNTPPTAPRAAAAAAATERTRGLRWHCPPPLRNDSPSRAHRRGALGGVSGRRGQSPRRLGGAVAAGEGSGARPGPHRFSRGMPPSGRQHGRRSALGSNEGPGNGTFVTVELRPMAPNRSPSAPPCLPSPALTLGSGRSDFVTYDTNCEKKRN